MNFSPIVKNREVVNSLVPSLAYSAGTDVAEWQSMATAKLSELLGISEIKPCSPEFSVVSEEDKGNHKAYRLSVQTEPDYYLEATLMIPAADLIPDLMVIPVGDDADLTAYLDLAAKLPENGTAVLLVEQRSFNNCFAMPGIFPEETKTRITWNACYRSSMRALMLGRTTLGERVSDVMRTIDAVIDNFAALKNANISMLGASGCGTVAYYTAALDKRISSVYVTAAVCSWQASIMEKSHCICNYVPYVANYFGMGDIGGLIAPRKLVIATFDNDEWLPIDGTQDALAEIERVYAACGAGENCVLKVIAGDRASVIENALNTLN